MGPLLTALPEESRSEGKIGFTIYKKYFSAGANYFVIFILLVLNILAQVSFFRDQKEKILLIIVFNSLAYTLSYSVCMKRSSKI